jgi:hypothetical protein
MSVPSWAVPGAKVVCVESSPTIKRGEIFTIQRVVASDFSGDWGVILLERASSRWLGGYKGWRFRPLVHTTTDDEVEQRLFRKKRLHQPVSARLTSA